MLLNLVEAVDRRHQLRCFHHRAVGDVVGGDGPEQRGGWIGRQTQPVGVRAVQEFAFRIPPRDRILRSGSQRSHDHGGSR